MIHRVLLPLLILLATAPARGGEDQPAPKSDGWVALQIRSLLMVRANVSATGTKVDVKEGVVTLTGIAESEEQRRTTTAVVREVEGVRSVENKMIVQAGPKPPRTIREVIDDASITAAVKKKILANHPASAGRMTIATKDGLVTLSGRAESEEEKELLTGLAKTVKGVTEVENKIVAQSSPQSH